MIAERLPFDNDYTADEFVAWIDATLSHAWFLYGDGHKEDAWGMVREALEAASEWCSTRDWPRVAQVPGRTTTYIRSLRV